MWYGQGWMFGMHFLWWIFRIGLIIVLAVLLFRRQPSAPQGPSQPTPLDILERRYAAGEISTAEFEERRARLKGYAR